MSQVETAPVNMFTTLRPRLLRGDLLKDVKAFQASILRFGLLSPIVVSRTNGRLVVIDGRKRLAAIKRLSFMGRLPRSLVNIPYVELEDAKQTQTQTPALMSNRELYMSVTKLFRDHQDVDLIAKDLFLTRRTVREVLTLARLSSRVRRAFFDKIINFGQARALATVPHQDTQDRIFMRLGPFATEAEILDHIRKPAAATPAAKFRLVA